MHGAQAVAVAFVVLAGCTASESGSTHESSAEAGRLHYHDAEPGQHVTSMACGARILLEQEWNLVAGQVSILVKDGAGAARLNKSYAAPSVGDTNRTLEGSDGEWSLTITRTAGSDGAFEGDYSFGLLCTT